VFADSALEPSRRQAEASPDDPAPIMLYAVMLSYVGQQQQAKAEAARALTLHRGTRSYSHHYDRLQMVRIFLVGGEHDAAISELEKLLSVGGEFTPAWLRVDPLFKSLRGNPRFEALTRKA
jgi:hypothetical protein